MNWYERRQIIVYLIRCNRLIKLWTLKLDGLSTARFSRAAEKGAINLCAPPELKKSTIAFKANLSIQVQKIHEDSTGPISSSVYGIFSTVVYQVNANCGASAHPPPPTLAQRVK